MSIVMSWLGIQRRPRHAQFAVNRAARMGRLAPQVLRRPAFCCCLSRPPFNHTLERTSAPDVFVESTRDHIVFRDRRPPLAIPGVADVEVLATSPT